MVNEVNGTKAIVQVDYGDGFFTTIGQIEFTNSYGASPIDISNKSFDDYVTLMDGQLAGKQFTLQGNIFYNSDTSYRKIRELALLGSEFRTKILALSDDPEDFIYWTVISSMSDLLNVGEGIATSITFLNRQDLGSSLASGELILSTNSVRNNFTYNSGQQGSLSPDLWVDGLGVAPSIVNLLAINIIPRTGNFTEYGIRLTLDADNQPRPPRIKIKIGNLEVRLMVQTSYNGVNEQDTIGPYDYFYRSRAFSSDNPLNNTAKIKGFYDYFFIITPPLGSSPAQNFEIIEDDTERLIIQSTISPQINPLDPNESGFIINDFGSLSVNYWDQLPRVSGNINGSELVTDFRANSIGEVILKTSLNSNVDYFSTVDLIIDNKTYNLERSSSAESKFTNGIYLSPSIDAGLEIYSLLSSGQPFSFKVIERPITISSGLVTIERRVISGFDTIGFIDSFLGSYISDNRAGIENPDFSLNQISTTQENSFYSTTTTLANRPLLREINFNNEFTATLTAVDANDRKEAFSTSEGAALELFNYLAGFDGQQVAVRVTIQDTPWIDPRDL